MLKPTKEQIHQVDLVVNWWLKNEFSNNIHLPNELLQLLAKFYFNAEYFSKILKHKYIKIQKNQIINTSQGYHSIFSKDIISSGNHHFQLRLDSQWFDTR